MILLSQLDPRWASKLIGSSNLSLGRWGCAVTSVSMISDYFKEYKSPETLAKIPTLFTKDGLIIWAELNNIFKKFKFVTREYKAKQLNIFEAIANPDTAVAVQVNAKQHWVVGYSNKSKNPDIHDFQVADPLRGKVVPVLTTFHNTTGAAFFQRVK